MDLGYDGRPPRFCRCRGFYSSLPSLEVVLVPVSDVDRAKTFYAENGLRPRREGEALDNVGFDYFDDPDGNGWTVQQISSRG
jgi:hypothetical protein